MGGERALSCKENAARHSPRPTPRCSSSQTGGFPDPDTYDVFLRCNATGEVRIHRHDLPWNEGSTFLWGCETGNYGCDCNRAIFFGGAAAEDKDDRPCGTTRYTVLKAVLPDGSEITIDDEPDTLSLLENPRVFAVRTAQTSANGHGVADNVSHTLDGAQGQAVAYGIDEEQNASLETMGCLKAREKGGGFEGTVAYRTAGDGAVFEEGENTAPLTTQTDPCAHILLEKPLYYSHDYNQDRVYPVSASSEALTATRRPNFLVRMAVRRLTPKECARLQGFSDEYLDINHRGKPAADGPKYKSLGNSMAVPCMLWIGQRIEAIRKFESERETCQPA